MDFKKMFKDPGIEDKGTEKKVMTPPIKKSTTPEKKDGHNSEVRSRPGERYTENELMVRLKFIIGCCLAFTLIGIVFTVLYSIMFVTQPLNAISPIDQKFFELIIPVATFLCGTLSGIMLAGSGKEAAMAGAAAQANAMNGQKGMSSPGGIRPLGAVSAGPIGPSRIMDDPMPGPMDDPMMPDPMPGPSAAPSGGPVVKKPVIRPVSV
jgi:hypothetical protein